ncbi:uncharacterized protein LOC113157245 [Anabas testudineus]|uniref:Immunoglobulin domain-containing protein n=1 Tax=Anabas testudineus TaxID=64144 RepID=A0A3Q1K601_ANATE|nr:uncharacterized protein LOC113157245 [Anabas testudineus]
MTSILMRAFILCSFGWISVSVSHDMKVKSGDSVTLLCPKTTETVITWFRLVNRTKTNCIALISKSNSRPEFCDGFLKGKFEMGTNVSTVFLKIKQVDLSDSGLYFCQFFFGGRSVYSVTYLTVEGSNGFQGDADIRSEAECETTKQMSLILGALTLFLVIVVLGLAVKNTASGKDHNPKHKNLFGDELKAETLSLFSTTIRSRRPALQTEVETRVIYGASRDSEWNCF